MALSKPLASVPRTPSGRHEEINLIIRQLNRDCNMELPVRSLEWSPSKVGLNSKAENCVDDVKFLYFSSRSELTTLITDFTATMKQQPNSNPVDLFVAMLHPVVGSRRKTKEERGRVKIQRQNHQDQSARLDTTNRPIRRSSFTLHRVASETEDESFHTPPQSPTLRASLRHSNADQSKRSQKRRSDGSLDDISPPNSAKAARTLSGHRASSSKATSAYQTAAPSPTIPQEAQMVFRSTTSTVPSVTSSFASTIPASTGTSNLTTANTSFLTEVTEPDSKDDDSYPLSWPSLDGTPEQRFNACHAYSSSYNEGMDIEGILLQADLEHKTRGLLSYPNFDSVKTDVLSSRGLPSEVLAAIWEQISKGTTMAKDIPATEQHQIRSLPQQGLFDDNANIPPRASKLDFRAVYECARIAQAHDLPTYDLVPNSISGSDDYKHLLDQIKTQCTTGEFDIPKLVTPQAWEASTGSYVNVELRGKLVFNAMSNGPLWKLALEPMQLDISSRFQRHFGGDRFLKVMTPRLDKVPYHLTGQQPYLNHRFFEWLNTDKIFLGRQWRPVLLEHHKPSKRPEDKEQEPTFRVILFATAGYDIPPHLHRTVGDLIDWFLPLSNPKNRKKPYCKISTRLELGFSKTQPSITFKPSQVIRVADVKADGTPEATEYDDPLLAPGFMQEPKGLVMNDGCARISVGACKLIWEQLKLEGSVPTWFQARIGGAKGMWSMSAELDTKETEHLDVWIEINASQQKFEPHAADEDDESYDHDRLTFEVHDYGRCPTTSALYLAFLPILSDRGVAIEALEQVLAGALESESTKLLYAIQDYVEFRRWMQVNFSAHEDKQRTIGILWQAALPLSKKEKINYLLQNGFPPKELNYLGTLVHEIVEEHYARLVQTLKISLPRSTMVKGIADPNGILQPGEIHLQFSGAITDPKSGTFDTRLNKQEVLVTRHPTIRPSDIQKVKAVYKTELAHLVDVVVFPSKGCIPLAHKLQGGDYDGDTFWVCWNEDLTRDFRNAPAPITLPNPGQFDIRVDERTLGDVLGESNSVYTFLANSFAFRSQPQFLGITTKLHEKLSYAENSVASAALEMTASLHHLLIDSSKSGFIFGNTQWNKFLGLLSTKTSQKVRNLPTPAHKQVMESGFKGVIAKILENPFFDMGNDSRVRPKIDHIIDRLFFKFVQPSVRDTFIQLAREIPLDEKSQDAQLSKLYWECIHDDDQSIQAEMKWLEAELEKISGEWQKANPHPELTSRYGRERSRDEWNASLNKIFNQYNAILPRDLTHPLLKYWTKNSLPYEPSRWSLIRASTFYTRYPWKSKWKMVFRIAGKDLAYIKSKFSPNNQTMTEKIWANMKMGKPKEVGTAGMMSAQDHKPATATPTSMQNEDKDVNYDDDDEIYPAPSQVDWDEFE